MNRKHYLAMCITAAICSLSLTSQAQESEAKKPQAQQGGGGGGIQIEKTVPVINSGKWTGKRTADGQPDISGHWSNTIANHNNFTDPQGGVINDPGASARRIAQSPRENRAPSRVTDPADGQVPFQPWAQAKVKEFQQYFNNPIKPEYVEPLARCAPAGIPKSLYWHGYEISQYPDY